MDQTRWRHVTRLPLTIAAIGFVASYSWRVIANLDPPFGTVTLAIMAIAWLMFVVDFVVNLALAPRRGRYFITHIHEFLIVLLPALSPLRLLQFIALLGVVHRALSKLRERAVYYAVGSAVLTVFVGSIAILDVERDAPAATITSFGNAVWWAIVTITTVGYGDLTPVTMLGRTIAAALMVFGIALVSTGAGSVASWLVDRGRARDDAGGRADATPTTELDELTAAIARLRASISASDIGASTSPAGATRGNIGVAKDDTHRPSTESMDEDIRTTVTRAGDGPDAPPTKTEPPRPGPRS